MVLPILISGLWGLRVLVFSYSGTVLEADRGANCLINIGVISGQSLHLSCSIVYYCIRRFRPQLARANVLHYLSCEKCVLGVFASFYHIQGKGESIQGLRFVFDLFFKVRNELRNTNNSQQSFIEGSRRSWLKEAISPGLFYVAHFWYPRSWHMLLQSLAIRLEFSRIFCRAEAGREPLEGSVWARAYHICLSHDHCCSASQSAHINAVPKMEAWLSIWHSSLSVWTQCFTHYMFSSLLAVGC